MPHFPPTPAATAPCPCGRTDLLGRKPVPRSFGACCGAWLVDGLPAPDPESLMRSRYTAFVLGREDYLRATWDAAHCPADLARYRLEGRAVRLHERSRFVRRGGRWFYTEGDDLRAG